MTEGGLPWLEKLLEYSFRGVRIEVESLDRSGLFEQCLRLRVLWDERGTLVCVILRNVSRNRPALVQDESIIVLLE